VWGSLPESGNPYVTTGQITDLRAGRNDCYDRLVIDLDGKGPSSYDVRYVDQLFEIGRGEVIAVRGGATIQIVVGSPAHDGSYNPTYDPANHDEAVAVGGFDTFRQVVFDGTFEGLTQIGLGVRARLPFRVFSLEGPGTGSRLVIDVAHRWPSGRSAPALPGEPVQAIFEAGTPLGVVGVGADDVLNVRALPGAGQPIVDHLEPLSTGLFFAGRARGVGGGVWYEIDFGHQSGWVNGRFVAPLAGTFDVTSEVVAATGGIPTGTSVTSIGADVVAVRIASADPAPGVIVSAGPIVGDLHEIIYDVTGFGDDSVYGERLHVVAAPADDGSGLLALKTVEATYLCQRGSGGQDLCP
jgi:hypothetical protein